MMRIRFCPIRPLSDRYPSPYHPDRSVPGFSCSLNSPTTMSAVLRKERRRSSTDPATISGKFGVAEWRDLRFLLEGLSIFCGEGVCVSV